MEDYNRLYHAIEVSADELCGTIGHGMLGKPEVMHRFSTSLNRLYASLHEYYLLQRPRDFVPPFPNGEFETMLITKMSPIHGLLTEYYTLLFTSISCSQSTIEGTKFTRIYPSMMLFYVVTKMMICVGQNSLLFPDDSYDNRNNLRPEDFSYARDNMLVMHDTPILQMNVKELFDSIKTLQARWNLLIYDSQLLMYMEMLEYRAAQLLHESWPSSVHNIDFYRKPVIPADKRFTDPTAEEEHLMSLYTYNDKLLWFFSGVFCNMRIRMGHHSVAPHVQCPEEWYPSEEEVTAIKAWFLRRADSTFADHITTEYRGCYLKLIMRPGEVEEFLMTKPNAVITEQQVYNQVRGRQATQRIQEFAASRQDKDPIDDDENEYPESLCSMGSVLMSSFFQGEFPETSWFTYCLFRDDIQVRSMEFTYEDGPFLVQSFNRFNVFYKKQILVTNGFLEALGCFMRIIEKEFNGAIDDGKLLMFPLFESIYGAEKGLDLRIKWQNRHLKGCHRGGDGPAAAAAVQITEETTVMVGKRKRKKSSLPQKKRRARMTQIKL